MRLYRLLIRLRASELTLRPSFQPEQVVNSATDRIAIPACTIAWHPTGARRTGGLELALLIACLGLIALAAWAPSIAQPAHYHAFADHRTLFGVPNLMDVLSNLAFAGFGLIGTWRLWRLPSGVVSRTQRNLAGLFFLGLIITTFLSGGYHLQPEDGGLANDRYGMTIAFAGLLGLAVASRISDRTGPLVSLAVLAFGALSISIWSSTGNVLPWGVLQFGGIALMLCLGLIACRAGGLPISCFAVILIYAVAKLLEQNDEQVFHLTEEVVSGHTLKHVVASLAAWPVIHALSKAHRSLESAAQPLGVAAKQ